jgi:hypothetical protein
MSQARLASAAMGGALGLALLSGCASGQGNVQDVSGDEPRTLAFECDDDLDFDVSLSSEEAHVEAGGRNYRLAAAGQEGGRRVYANEDDVRLTVGDRDTNLRIPGVADYENCERI